MTSVPIPPWRAKTTASDLITSSSVSTLTSLFTVQTIIPRRAFFFAVIPSPSQSTMTFTIYVVTDGIILARTLKLTILSKETTAAHFLTIRSLVSRMTMAFSVHVITDTVVARTFLPATRAERSRWTNVFTLTSYPACVTSALPSLRVALGIL